MLINKRILALTRSRVTYGVRLKSSSIFLALDLRILSAFCATSHSILILFFLDTWEHHADALIERP